MTPQDIQRLHERTGTEVAALIELHRIWRRVHPEDRLRFLIEMLTPNERRAIQMGLEDAVSDDS